MKLQHGLLIAVMALVAWPTVSVATPSDAPLAHAAATCADYANQAEAQRAADTRDPDGDGIYCESLPCPCLPPDPRAGGTPAAPVPTPVPTPVQTPVQPQFRRPLRHRFQPQYRRPLRHRLRHPSSTTTSGPAHEAGGRTAPRLQCRKYPHINGHVRGAIPERLAPHPRAQPTRGRPAAQPLLKDVLTARGFDRDEYPPAVGRGKGAGLQRGTRPRGWRADVRYVPSSENRSHGAVLGNLLEDFCNGTRFRYVFR